MEDEDVVVEYLNEEFSDNLERLEKVDEILAQKKQEVELLHKKHEAILGGCHEIIVNSLRECELVISDGQTACGDYYRLVDDFQELEASKKDFLHNMQQLILKEKRASMEASYVSWIERVENLSQEIIKALEASSISVAIDEYSSLLQIFEQLHTTSCKNLSKYLQDALLYWHKVLKKLLRRELEQLFEIIHWPFTTSPVTAPSTDIQADCEEHLEKLFSYLLKLQLPSIIELPDEIKDKDSKQIVAPIVLLVKPLKKRFRFHFYGKKQTNSIAKPEWYFTQVLNWIRDHSHYLQFTIQPILAKIDCGHVDARLEFIRGLVLVLIEKIKSDMPLLLNDDYYFSHTIDELLLFENELHNKYYYPSELPSCITALEQDVVIDKWIDLELKNGKEKIDEILSSATAWKPKYKEIPSENNLKFPEATENILTVLIMMKERYSKLTNSSYLMRFVRLQLKILDRVQLKFIELKHAGPEQLLDHDYSYMLNGVNHLISILQKWSDQWFFLDLYAKEVKLLVSGKNLNSSDNVDQTNAPEDGDGAGGTIFDGILGLFSVLLDEMLEKLISDVLQIIKEKSRPYCKQKWLSLRVEEDSLLQLSPSACDLLVSLRDSLQYYQMHLDSSLFIKFWQRLAQVTSDFLFRDLVLCNHFNNGGAKQLQFDITKNLFVLFREYTHRPENIFKKLKEACILLNLSCGSVLLLQEILEAATSTLNDSELSASKSWSSAIAALSDVNIYRLEPDKALQVIRHRVDLPKV